MPEEYACDCLAVPALPWGQECTQEQLYIELETGDSVWVLVSSQQIPYPFSLSFLMRRAKSLLKFSWNSLEGQQPSKGALPILQDKIVIVSLTEHCP